MHDEHQLSQSEGPSPTDVDEDAGETLEERISAMTGYEGVDDHTTLAEQLDGDTIDERNRREQPQRERGNSSVDLLDGDDEDGTDREGALVAEAEEADGPVPPELAAMHVVDDAPGVVDHPDDYVED